MSAKIKASSDGLKVTIGNAAEDALEINQTAKTIMGSMGMPSCPLTSYANDSAAAVGGVAIGGLYHTSGAVKVRLV